MKVALIYLSYNGERERQHEMAERLFGALRQKVEVDREPKRLVLSGRGTGTIIDKSKSIFASPITEDLNIADCYYMVAVHSSPNHEVICADSGGTGASVESLQPLKMYFERHDLRHVTRLRELFLRNSQVQKQSVDLTECMHLLLSTIAMQSLVRDRKHATIHEILLRNLERTLEERSKDGVQEYLENLCREVTSSSDNSCAPKTVGNRCGELRWTMQERYGFLWNRLITFPEKKAELHSSGIDVLGGILPALEFACTTFFNAVASYMDKRKSRLLGNCSDGSGVAAWTRLLADALNIDITREDTGGLSAFLVQTTSKRRIYASRDLEPHALSMAVLHEIAHFVLRHRPANECGLSYETLPASDAAEFDVQERAADAMAVLWEHIFLGLGFLVNACRGEQSEEQEPLRQERPPPAGRPRKTTLNLAEVSSLSAS